MRKRMIVNAGITKEQLFIFKELYLTRPTWIAIYVVGDIPGEEKNIVTIDFEESEFEFIVGILDLMGFKIDLKEYELLNLN